MTKIMMNRADVELLGKILEENCIDNNFWVLYTANSGIGYSLDLEYSQEINGREATIRIPITGVENW
jgi:hypothetical protein